MAKNGSSRCFFCQKRVYLKTIAAESVVGHICLANIHFLPFLAILCSVFGHFMFLSGGLLDYYIYRSTWATWILIFSLNSQQQNDAQVTWRLTIFSRFSVNNFGAKQLSPCLSGRYSEVLLHQPEPQQEPTVRYIDREMHRLPSKSPVGGSMDQRRLSHCGALRWLFEDDLCHRKTCPDMILLLTQ